MTREAFIRKWLANPQKQYTEQCRDEMRDDLDLVIQAALRQPLVSGMLKCVSCDNTAKKEGFDCYGKCHICTQSF